MNSDHETISEYLESARYMPADLQRDPSGLLRACLRIMREHGDDPMALSRMLEATMIYICARHRRQIIDQMKKTANEHRRSLH